MPNWVYNNISVEEKYAEKLQEIVKNGGICETYRPIPRILKESTQSPTKIVSVEEYIESRERNKTAKYKTFPITQELSDTYKKLYGYDNWYDWSNINWGTKWGECHPDCDGAVYSYSTAWSPLSFELLKELAKDIPNFRYDWEEEQGQGEIWNCYNGEFTLELEYGIPEFELVLEGDRGHGDITYLTEDYENPEGKYKQGYYAYYDLNNYLGDTLEEAKAELKNSTS